MIKKSVLCVIVNYGEEQIKYLNQVVGELKSFENYNVTVIVHSNIDLDNPNIDKVEVFNLPDFQLLPLTCRKTIWENRDDYDLFIFSENDMLFKEQHLKNFEKYTAILPENRIAGLLRVEKYDNKNFYMDYHTDYDWDYNSLEEYEGKKFAHFTNLHHAAFLVNKEQLKKIGSKINFLRLYPNPEFSYIAKAKRFIKRSILKQIVKNPDVYSVKCKVGTDIYQFAGYKKMICISDLNENCIHHLPNIYKKGEKGRYQLGSEEERMDKALERLLKNVL